MKYEFKEKVNNVKCPAFEEEFIHMFYLVFFKDFFFWMWTIF